MAPTLPLLDIELAHVARLPDGRSVEWEAVGTGHEPLVWVEGGPGLPAHLARADVVPLVDRFRCHLVNGPGSGRTSVPADEAGYDLDRLVELFDAWRAVIGLGPVTVMGHSWGGLLACAWAALRPASVRRLICVDGYAGGGSVDHALVAAERERALERHRARPWFADAWAIAAGVDEATGDEASLVAGFRTIFPLYFADPDAAVSAAHIERIRREVRFHAAINNAWSGERETADYRHLLGRVDCPTLVVAGEHDWICGPTWARSVAAAIPAARLVVLPGVGHLPQYEAPAAFRAEIDAWLADAGGQLLRPSAPEQLLA